MGVAYALFNCRAAKGAIEAEIEEIRKVVGTPSALETSLYEGMASLRGGDPKLDDVASQAEAAGLEVCTSC